LEQYNVVNEKGQDLGRVQNLVIDMVAGRIAFVVVPFGGMLG
jgi:sporulation protein YlmC with PRC-barrel domain